MKNTTAPKLCYSLVLPLLGTSAMAADLAIKVEVPKLPTAEYHRPYVAFWVEKADQTFANNLAIWYNPPKGDRWLKDMRQWWRVTGRDLKLPVDGFSSPSRSPGEHVLNFSSSSAPFNNLAAGDYQLVVEAAREQGGREVVRIPFKWPVKSNQTLTAKGEEELGAISLQLKL